MALLAPASFDLAARACFALPAVSCANPSSGRFAATFSRSAGEGVPAS